MDPQSGIHLLALCRNSQNKQLIRNILGLKQCNWVNCKNKNKELKLCKCHQVYYCSRECQKKDWNCSIYGYIAHKKSCKKRIFK